MTARRQWSDARGAVAVAWRKLNPQPPGTARNPTPALLAWAKARNLMIQEWEAAHPRPALTPKESAELDTLRALHARFTNQ